MIFGIGNNNNFCYRTYNNIENPNIYQGNCLILNITSTEVYIDQFDGRYLSGTKIILSTIIDGKFIVYRIDYQNYEIKSHIIKDNNFDIHNYGKRNIQCDSYDAINFLCILTYRYDNWKLFYFRGTFESGNENVGTICDNECFLGNIIKINNSNNKFLVCYQKDIGNLISIVCQYFSYENDKLLIGIDKEIGRASLYSSLKHPLILYISDNSILIQVDIGSDVNSNSILILSSLDFIINIQSNLISATNEIKTVNVFNEGNYIFIIYEDGSTKVTRQEILNCISDNSIISSNNEITLSNGRIKEADFKNGHNDHIIFFSLDSNIYLYKADNENKISDNDYSIVGTNSFIFLQKENKKFFLGKKIIVVFFKIIIVIPIMQIKFFLNIFL